jgi:hypothetical protein
MIRSRLVALVLIVAFMPSYAFSAEEPASQGMSTNWITDAPSDAERFERIQKYLRGFDETMHEVGERFEKVHEAIEAENYDLALYHWDKIKLTIENGLMKRPARKANAEALFLDTTWANTQKAFASRDKAQVWQGFELARGACMACHAAEKVEFINNQPLFTDRVAPQRGRSDP